MNRSQAVDTGLPKVALCPDQCVGDTLPIFWTLATVTLHEVPINERSNLWCLAIVRIDQDKRVSADVTANSLD